jgi:hypothetical protein
MLRSFVKGILKRLSRLLGTKHSLSGTESVIRISRRNHLQLTTILHVFEFVQAFDSLDSFYLRKI